MSDQQLREFFEYSRDFHRQVARHDRHSLFYTIPMTVGTAALSGYGVHIALEEDPQTGLLLAGVFAYATKVMGEISLQSWRYANQHEQTANERQQQIDRLEPERQ